MAVGVGRQSGVSPSDLSVLYRIPGGFTGVLAYIPVDLPEPMNHDL
jgi:hypothetical protein